jgi:hypothetical protein
LRRAICRAPSRSCSPSPRGELALTAPYSSPFLGEESAGGTSFLTEAHRWRGES